MLGGVEPLKEDRIGMDAFPRFERNEPRIYAVFLGLTNQL